MAFFMYNSYNRRFADHPGGVAVEEFKVYEMNLDEFKAFV